MNGLNLNSASEEELQVILDNIHAELNRRAMVSLEEAKTKAVIAIRELIAVCRKLGICYLGDIHLECEECDYENYIDILEEDVLEEIANILERK